MSATIEQQRAALAIALKAGKITPEAFIEQNEKLAAQAPTAPTNGKGVAIESKTNLPAPMNRATFVQKAPTMDASIGGAVLVCEPRQMSTGNVGYLLSGKLTILVDGKPVKFQVSGSVVAINSKSWPE